MGIFCAEKISNPPGRLIPPQTPAGFENSRILDHHLKPQSSPPVLKPELNPNKKDALIGFFIFCLGAEK